MSLNNGLFCEIKMFFWFYLLSTALSSVVRDLKNSSTIAEKILIEFKIPLSDVMKDKKPSAKLLSDIIDENSEKYILFMSYVNKGYTNKGLTFNIYDANMRHAAIAMFQILESLNGDLDTLNDLENWAHEYVNDDLYEYVCRLTILYNDNTNVKYTIHPPFVYKPHFYVNGEAIIKALKIYTDRKGLNNLDPVLNQFHTSKSIIINANYSGWNLYRNGCDSSLDYFREDISLNSYYYGIHLMHPYWMSNNKLDSINPRHSEFYYFRHQQLMARYQLEKQHLIQSNHTVMHNFCDDNYNSYLIYKNGLPFPIRSNILEDSSEGKAFLKSIDIGINDCFMQKCVVLENGTSINLTEDNYVDLLAKFIKANYDGINSANKFRSLFGYGAIGYPAEKYNPAPSLLHHPETSLRDPEYWHIIQYMLKYFTKFSKTLEPFDLSAYETDVVRIVDGDFSDLITTFKNYQFDIRSGVRLQEHLITVRQRRLEHFPFMLNFRVYSEYDTLSIVRIFLGPPCHGTECWQRFSEFFQLSVNVEMLEKGINSISFRPDEDFKTFSHDEKFNYEFSHLWEYMNDMPYNIFKFPKSLLLPKGLEIGLNLTLFVMVIAHPKPDTIRFHPDRNIYYNRLSHAYDTEPLGFPFHRLAKNCKYSANNYKFFNITVVHQKRNFDGNGYFSPHLY